MFIHIKVIMAHKLKHRPFHRKRKMISRRQRGYIENSKYLPLINSASASGGSTR
jgi:hypothetical protein